MRYGMIATDVAEALSLVVVTWRVATSRVGSHAHSTIPSLGHGDGRRQATTAEAVATLPGMTDVHALSPEAHQRLRDELATLTGEGRIDIARKIETARELGDLSENGDYHAAKDEQGKMEARIRQLEALLEDAVVVEGGSGDGTARIGSTVTVRFDDGDTETYLVGSIEERGGDHEVVSPGSPLGSALLGNTAGSSVTYDANGNDITVGIVSVEG